MFLSAFLRRLPLAIFSSPPSKALRSNTTSVTLAGVFAEREEAIVAWALKSEIVMLYAEWTVVCGLLLLVSLVVVVVLLLLVARLLLLVECGGKPALLLLPRTPCINPFRAASSAEVWDVLCS